MNLRRFVLILILALLLAAAFLILSRPRSASYADRAADPLEVVVSEIAWSGTAVSSSDEWIELYNNTGSGIDLTGWTLSAADGTPSVTPSGSIPAGGYFPLERGNDDSVPGVAADLIYTGALSNDGEDLVLRDDASNTIDRVDCGAGWFAGHADGRVPMVRLDTLADGSLPDNWEHNPRCGSATNSAGIGRQCGHGVMVMATWYCSRSRIQESV